MNKCCQTFVYNEEKDNGTVFRMLPGIFVDLTRAFIEIKDYNQ